MMGDVRVLPLLVFAGLCLLALKAMGLLLSGSYVLSGAAPASAQNQPPAVTEQKAPGKEQPQEQPERSASMDESEEAQPEPAETAQKEAADGAAKPQQDTGESTGKPAAKTAEKKVPSKQTDVLSTGPVRGTTRSELAVLEGLANRRKALDQRDREIDLRENLLMAAEKRVEARITELKAIESRIESELKKRDDHRKGQYQRLVKMYSGMKPKEAARIFDRLELNVLTGLVAQMKPRVMSAIMAAMNPAAAERLTLEIASRGKPKTRAAAVLPKIQSQ